MRRYSIDTVPANAEFNANAIVSVKQIGSKQAWVLSDANGNRWLQSYRTIVSKYIGGVLTHLGKWSCTTSHHQSAFYRYCR